MIICLGATPALQRVMTFDGLILDEVNRARTTRASIAGKSINVAKVLSALGEKVLATGFAGGVSGKTLCEELDRLGITHRFVTVDPPTRTCVTIIDRSTARQTELVEESQPVPSTAYDALFAALGQCLSGARMLMLSGTLTPGAPQDFYARCTTLARGCGVDVLIDAHGAPLQAALPAGPRLIKPNRLELARMLGVPPQDTPGLRAAAAELLMRNRTAAVITLGSEGAWAFENGRWLRVTIPQVQAINAIGSGDSVAAGLAAALSRGETFDQALRLGMACGVANALTELAGEVSPADVQSLLPRIVISET